MNVLKSLFSVFENFAASDFADFFINPVERSLALVFIPLVVYVLLKGKSCSLFPRKSVEHIALYVFTVLQIVMMVWFYHDESFGWDLINPMVLAVLILLLDFIIITVILFWIVGLLQFFYPGNKKACTLKILYLLYFLFWSVILPGDILLIPVTVIQFVLLQRVTGKYSE